MENSDQYFFLGKLTKTHGFEGKLNIWLDVDEPEYYSKLESIFLDMNGNYIPYFIEELNLNLNKGVVQLEDVDDADKAAELVGKDIYLPIEMLPKKTGNSFYFHEVVGFKIIDTQFGDVGIIKTVLDYPSQSLFQVITDKNKEVLIPMNGNIIQKLDRENKTITVKVPEGLIELYINE